MGQRSTDPPISVIDKREIEWIITKNGGYWYENIFIFAIKHYIHS